jgi:hypothetical protein
MDDERSIQTYRNIGSKVYALTVWLMMAAMIYRRRVLGQSLEDYWDIATIFFATGLIYISANLYFIGIFPERLKQASIRIFFTMATIGLFTGIISGRITSFKQGLETLIGISIATGIVTMFFFFFSFWGKKKIDSEIDE